MTQDPLPIRPNTPVTLPQLVSHLRPLGVEPGMTLLVHSSLKKIGWVSGGAVAVILALEEVLTPDGTLIMPTHTSDLSDPANWKNPPVPAGWWQPIRETVPAFQRDLTPTHGMGAIPEAFRKQDGVMRSDRPHVSFAAWGKHASLITRAHPLVPLFGEESPVGRVYDLGGWVLLLGVGHGNNTSLHLAEYRANIAHAYESNGSPMLVDGVRKWVPWTDVDWDDHDFVELGAAFGAQTGLQRHGSIGNAPSLLAPQRPLIDFGVQWLEKNRV